MIDTYFVPLIEGVLAPDNNHPIFVKALTHNSRLIRLPEGFLDRRDHVDQARRLILAHHRKYLKSTLAESFPFEHYIYLIAPTRSVRFSIDGQNLGIFKDIPANPSFRVGKKRYEIADE